jgi:hypothetical protein
LALLRQDLQCSSAECLHVGKTDCLNRKAQVEYLNQRMPGWAWSIGKLEWHACKGTGPKYRMLLHRAVSTPSWLDEWIEGLLTAPAGSKTGGSLTRRRSAAVDPTASAA